jgi:hypothetical protein
MNPSLLIEAWRTHKAAEDEAKAKRREVEDQIVKAMALPENFEGYKRLGDLKVEGKLNRKVDADKVQELAAEYGLTAHLSSLFRWKPELNMTAWKAADEAITRPLLAAITTTAGRPSFSFTQPKE